MVTRINLTSYVKENYGDGAEIARQAVGRVVPLRQADYGGEQDCTLTSIVTLYAMLGLVSGVYARPTATSHERYIRAPLK